MGAKMQDQILYGADILLTNTNAVDEAVDVGYRPNNSQLLVLLSHTCEHC